MTVEEFVHVVFDDTDHTLLELKVHDTYDEVFQESRIEPEAERINKEVLKPEIFDSQQSTKRLEDSKRDIKRQHQW